MLGQKKEISESHACLNIPKWLLNTVYNQHGKLKIRFFQLNFSINTIESFVQRSFSAGDITIREYFRFISENLMWNIEFPSKLIIIMMLCKGFLKAWNTVCCSPFIFWAHCIQKLTPTLYLPFLLWKQTSIMKNFITGF